MTRTVWPWLLVGNSCSSRAAMAVRSARAWSSVAVGRQPAHAADEVPAAIGGGRVEPERQEDVGGAVGVLLDVAIARRQHADHGVRLRVDAHRPADDAGRPGEAPPPEPVADERDPRRVGPILLRQERPAQGRLDPERREIGLGDPHHPDAFGVAFRAADGGRADEPVRAHRGERAGVAGVVEEVGRREIAHLAVVVVEAAQLDELLGCGVGQWGEQHRAHHAEHRRVGADAEGQRADGDQGEAGVGEEAADGEPEVLRHGAIDGGARRKVVQSRQRDDNFVRGVDARGSRPHGCRRASSVAPWYAFCTPRAVTSTPRAPTRFRLPPSHLAVALRPVHRGRVAVLSDRALASVNRGGPIMSQVTRGVRRRGGRRSVNAVALLGYRARHGAGGDGVPGSTAARRGRRAAGGTRRSIRPHVPAPAVRAADAAGHQGPGDAGPAGRADGRRPTNSRPDRCSSSSIRRSTPTTPTTTATPLARRSWASSWTTT